MNNLNENNINNLYNDNDNNNEDKVNSNNKNIEGYEELNDLNDLNVEEKKSYSLKEEIKRVIDFYKDQPSILIIVLFITYLLYYCFKSNTVTNNIKHLNMKGGSDWKPVKDSIFELLVNTKLWNGLKQQFDYDGGIMNKIVVIFGYIFLGFIVRPIKAFFYVFIILVGISGSFLFPFLVFGIMLYYVFKKVIFNKKPKLD
jgi:hypothetical protein